MLKAKQDKTLCADPFNGFILSAMLYARKIWATTKKKEQKLVITQRAMERSKAILEISLHDYIQSEVIYEQSEVK